MKVCHARIGFDDMSFDIFRHQGYLLIGLGVSLVALKQRL